jgi:hypothetical protein
MKNHNDLPAPGEMFVYCRFCDVAYVVECTEEQNQLLLERANGEGKLIQEIFPELSEELREMFISGMCGTCWDKTFKDPKIED